MRDSVWRRSVTSSWVLIRYCGSPAWPGQRRATGQEQPQPVVGADRMFFGEQAALPDRRLVARNDQLRFSRIENIRRRQSGGILAPAVENGLGAAIGEKVSSVTDALDGQRDRNVIDNQFEELFGVFQLA